MAKLAKKQIREIESISLFTEVLKNNDPSDIAGKHWTDCRPDMWQDSEVRLYDMMNELEMKIKEEVLRIVNERK